MSEVKDPAIKLFGKTIPLLPKQQVSVSTSPNKNNCDSDEQEDGKKSSESEFTATTREEEEDYSLQAFEGLKDQETSCDNPKTQSVEEEPNSPKPSKDEDQSETSLSQEMTLKKPEKILPCPRCNSMETKFCYYNNYNVNQPRHFCRKCQRFWTAGGTMRNVPVGSGRRKNKSAYALHSRHVMVSECLQAARANGTVLSFGADAQPRCESTAPALNPVEKSVKISVSCGRRGENGDDDTRTSDSSEKRGNGNPVLQGSVAKKFPCFAGRPCFFPWNSPEWRPAIPPPALLGLSGFPAPPYWGCALSGPWIPSPPCSTLGKHSRDESEKEEAMKESNSDTGGVWIPKTLRIDDLNEAAKSSIWSALMFKNEKDEARGLFAAFQSRGDGRTDEKSLLLQANPAALLRSFNFRETV